MILSSLFGGRAWIAAVLTIAVTSLSMAAPATPSRPKPKVELKTKAAAKLRQALQAHPADAEKLMKAAMRENPGAACAIVNIVARALPQKDGKPDVVALAALAKAAVKFIYEELPTARSEVKCIVVSVIDVLGANPDPRAILQILRAVLADILANDPALARALIELLKALYPDAAALLSQLESNFFSALNGALNNSNSVLPRTPPPVEPNMSEPATPINPPQP